MFDFEIVGTVESAPRGIFYLTRFADGSLYRCAGVNEEIYLVEETPMFWFGIVDTVPDSNWTTPAYYFATFVSGETYLCAGINDEFSVWTRPVPMLRGVVNRLALAFTEANEGPLPAPAASEESDTDNERGVCGDCGHVTDRCECNVCARCDERGPDLEVCSECDRCIEECCGCASCEGCGRRGRRLSICDCCEQCSDCCDCNYCDSCENHYRGGGCGECDRCESCCGCESANDLLVERSVRFYAPGKLDHKRNPTSRFIAAEIEVAGCARDSEAVADVAREWHCSIVDDGSLPDSGFEINTSPAGGDKFCRQIVDFYNALAKAGAKITGACGLHIHIDARDFRYYDLRRLVLLYAKLEKALFATQPDSRREGRYCMPCGENYAYGMARALAPKASKARLLTNIYGETNTRYYRKDKLASARYHALNLHSWVYRGTIECRLHTGTVSSDKIIPWGICWAALLDYALATPEKAISGLKLPTMESAQSFLLDVIAPTDEVRSYLLDRWTKFYGSVPSRRTAA